MLQALYLDPLRGRVKKNGGHVYPGGSEFTLFSISSLIGTPATQSCAIFQRVRAGGRV
jgi:hypothetical protein